MPAERATGHRHAVLEQQDQLAVRRQELLGRIAGRAPARRRRTGRRSGVSYSTASSANSGRARASSGWHADDLEPGCGGHRTVRDDGGECGTCGNSRTGRTGMRARHRCLPATAGQEGWEAGAARAAGDRRTGQGEVSDRARCWCAAGRPSGDRRDRATGCARCSRSPVPRHGSSFWPHGGACWLAGTDVPARSSPGAPRHSGGLPASEPGLDAGTQDLGRDCRAANPLPSNPIGLVDIVCVVTASADAVHPTPRGGRPVVAHPAALAAGTSTSCAPAVPSVRRADLPRPRVRPGTGDDPACPPPPRPAVLDPVEPGPSLCVVGAGPTAIGVLERLVANAPGALRRRPPDRCTWSIRTRRAAAGSGAPRSPTCCGPTPWPLT